MFCSHKEKGCQWTGELRELDKHLNLNPTKEKLLHGCKFATIKCTYCSSSFQRHSLSDHQTNDCLKRPYTCKHCGFAATFEEVTQQHFQVCTLFCLPCPNKCKKMIQRQKMDHHVRENCPLTLVKCDFQRVGCKIQLPRRDIPAHMSDNILKHMSLLQTYMTAHPHENSAIYNTCV